MDSFITTEFLPAFEKVTTRVGGHITPGLWQASGGYEIPTDRITDFIVALKADLGTDWDVQIQAAPNQQWIGAQRAQRSLPVLFKWNALPNRLSRCEFDQVTIQ